MTTKRVRTGGPKNDVRVSRLKETDEGASGPKTLPKSLERMHTGVKTIQCKVERKNEVT